MSFLVSGIIWFNYLTNVVIDILLLYLLFFPCRLLYINFKLLNTEYLQNKIDMSALIKN